MKVLSYPMPNKAQIVDCPAPQLSSSQSLGRTLVSNVSAGTEMAFYRGTAPQINSEMIGTGLWVEAENSLTYPMNSGEPDCWWMGYAAVSKIIDTGSTNNGLKEGDVVFTYTGHKDTQYVDSNYIKIPQDITPEKASFLALTAIAFNGLLDSDVRLMDRVLVIGMGTIGQIMVQLCKLAGTSVIAVDLIDSRLELASKLGADRVINPGKVDDLAEAVFGFNGRGVDTVFEISGNSAVLNDAVRCVRKDGQVIVLSFYQTPPANFQMGREFHHNRVRIRSSQIGGINPSVSNRYDVPERSNTVLELLKKIDTTSLISHRCKFNDYPETLEIISKRPQDCNSVIIEY